MGKIIFSKFSSLNAASMISLYAMPAFKECRKNFFLSVQSILQASLCCSCYGNGNCNPLVFG